MASALSEYADILWVDPPTSPVTLNVLDSSRLPFPRLTWVSESIQRLSVKTVPFHTRGFLRALSASLVRWQIRLTLTKIGRQPAAIVVSHFSSLLGSGGRGVLNVFYGTDDFVGGAELMGVSRRRIEMEEKRQLKRADVVVAVSDHLAARWRGMGFHGPLATVPNGVSSLYGRSVDAVIPADVNLERPIAGFIGHLSSRIDIGLMESVVSAGCSLLLVGPYDRRWEPERFRALVSNPRVKWTGSIRFEQLLPYLKAMDVGITPYVNSDFNRASFPLKTLEYLAAGKPAVSTDLPSLRWLATDLVQVADSTSFGTKVAEVATMQSAEDAARRMAFAQSHSWDERAKAFASAIGLHRHGVTIVGPEDAGSPGPRSKIA